jgi:AraC family transcriptional regulator
MQRMLRGLQYIEENLAEPIQLADVASAAGYSLFHCCRLFQALTGGTVMSYVRKRRLTKAAEAIMAGDNIRLIELALECGFESQAAFTRAFRAQFGITPGALRRSDRTWLPRLYPKLTEASLAYLTEIITMQPTFIEHDDIHIAGLKDRVGDGGEQDGTPIWRRFRSRMDDIESRVGDHSFGVVELVDKEKGQIDYWASIEVAKETEVPEDLETRTLSGGRFAVFEHTLTSPDIGAELRQAFHYIYDSWLPSSGEQLRAYFDLEHYDDRFDPKTLSGTLEIWVPVK